MNNKIKALLSAVLCLLLSFCLFACGEEASVKLDRNNATLEVGQTVELTAEAVGGDVTWTSDNAAVATVNNGVVTAVSAGTAKITATVGDKSDYVMVTVQAETTYAVRFDNQVQKVKKGEAAVAPEDPVKAATAQYSYTFDGWYVIGTDTKYDVTAAVVANVSLESRFTATVNEYEVSFDGASAGKVAYGSLLTAPTAPTKAPEGTKVWAFDGWYDQNGNAWNFASSVVTGKVELTARFIEVATSYKVTVDGVEQLVAHGTAVKLPAAPASYVDADGYEWTFDGWYNGDAEWAATDVVTGELTLTAKFVKSVKKVTYTVNYVVNGEATPVDVQYGNKLDKPADPETWYSAANVYTFSGWYVKGTGVAWNFDNAVTENIDLEARYTVSARTYTVSYDTGNGLETMEVVYGGYAKLPTPTDPQESEQYVRVFTGWYVQVGTSWVRYDAALNPVTEDIEVTAMWSEPQAKYHVVTYKNEKGEVISTVNVKVGLTVQEPSYNMTKEQTVSHVYKHVGWTANGTDLYDFSKVLAEDITLAPLYEESDRYYTVTLYNGSEIYDTVSVKYNDAFSYDDSVLPEHATEQYYAFEYWTLDLNNPVNNNELANVVADVELYAYYTDREGEKYTVTFYGVAAEGEDPAVLETFADVAYNSECKVTVPEIAATNTTRYVFAGWADADGVIVWEAGDVVRCKGDAELYPVFTEETIYYNIAVDLNDECFTLVGTDGAELTAEDLSVEYGTVVEFIIAVNAEAYGEMRVANGTAAIYPNAEGVYSLNVKGSVRLTVTGLAMREYAIAGKAVFDAKQSTVEWAKTLTKASDALIELTVNGESEIMDVIAEDGTYAIENLSAGEYTVKFVYWNEYDEEYRYVSDTVATYNLNYSLDTDNDGEGVADMGNVSVGMVESYLTKANIDLGAKYLDGVYKYDNYTVNDKYKNIDLTPADFAPGKNDFAVTASWTQDIETQGKLGTDSGESQPTVGFNFYGAGKHLFIGFYDSGTMKISTTNKAQETYHDLLSETGGFMGWTSWTDSFRNANLVYVREGNWLNVYVNVPKDHKNYKNGASTSYSVIERVNTLLVSIDVTTGSVYMTSKKGGGSKSPTDLGEYRITTYPEIAEIFADVTSVRSHFGTTPFSCVGTYGLNWTTNADVIASYGDLAMTNVKVNYDAGAVVSYNGAFARQADGSRDLNIFNEGKITIQLKPGMVFKDVVVNGESNYSVNDLNQATYTLSIDRERANEYVVDVTTVPGEYININGTVNLDSILEYGKINAEHPVVKLTNDEYTFTVNAERDGSFTARVVEGEYEAHVLATNLWQETAPISFTTDEAFNLAVEPYLLGGAVALGDNTYYSDTWVYQKTASGHSVPAFATTPGTHTFEVSGSGDDAVYTSNRGTTSHSEFLMFTDFTASQFVAKATFNLTDLSSDAYPRIGFLMADASGNYGGLTTLGHADNAVDSLVGGDCDWYKQDPGVSGDFRAVEYGAGAWNGRGASDMNGEKMELIVVYNDGIAQFYIRQTDVWGAGYRLLWNDQVPTLGTLSSGWTGEHATAGKVLQWGTKLSGEVAIGLITTFNTSTGYFWSDISIEEGQAAIDAFNSAANAVVLSDEAAKVADITVTRKTAAYTTADSRITVLVTPKTKDIIFTDIKLNGGSIANQTGYYNVNYSTGAWAIDLKRTVDATVIDVVTAPRPADYNVRPDDKKQEMTRNADGSIITRGDYNATQESPMVDADGNAVTFIPSQQILTYQFTYTGLTTAGKYYPLVGMYVRSQDGGTIRMANSAAGDVTLFTAKEDYMSRRNWQNGDYPWQPMQRSAGCFVWSDVAGVNFVDIRVVIDGYNWQVWARSRKANGECAEGTWGLMYATTGDVANQKTLDVRNLYASTDLDNSSNHSRLWHQNTLYNIDEPCTFGVSSRRDYNSATGYNKTENLAKFQDFYWKVTDRDDETELIYSTPEGQAEGMVMNKRLGEKENVTFKPANQTLTVKYTYHGTRIQNAMPRGGMYIKDSKGNAKAFGLAYNGAMIGFWGLDKSKYTYKGIEPTDVVLGRYLNGYNNGQWLWEANRSTGKDPLATDQDGFFEMDITVTVTGDKFVFTYYLKQSSIATATVPKVFNAIGNTFTYDASDLGVTGMYDVNDTCTFGVTAYCGDMFYSSDFRLKNISYTVADNQ